MPLAQCQSQCTSNQSSFNQLSQDNNKSSILQTNLRPTEAETLLRLLPKTTELTKPSTLVVDSDLLETIETLKSDSKILIMNQTSMDTEPPQLEIKFQTTETETDSELEHQLIPLTTP